MPPEITAMLEVQELEAMYARGVAFWALVLKVRRAWIFCTRLRSFR
ncbi:MAG TPA: hypothetical protein VN577_20205 [Terriglobales bacterium]|nr:hypothetical protein [Terriglobales bacterium]